MNTMVYISFNKILFFATLFMLIFSSTVACSRQYASNTFALVENTTKTLLVMGEPRTGIFSGATVNGIPNGIGEFTSQNSDGVEWTYTGFFANGLFHGEGTTVWESGARQSGEFRFGELYTGNIYSDYGTLAYTLLEGELSDIITEHGGMNITVAEIAVIINFSLAQTQDHIEFSVDYDPYANEVVVNVWRSGLVSGLAIAQTWDAEGVAVWERFVTSMRELAISQMELLETAEIHDTSLVLVVLDDANMDNALLRIINGRVVFDALWDAVEPETHEAEVSPQEEPGLVGTWLWNGNVYYVFHAGGRGTMAGIDIRWWANYGTLSICTTPATCGIDCRAPTEWLYSIGGMDRNTLNLASILPGINFTYTRG